MSLFKLSGPSTVAWFISSAVVDAVNRRPGRRLFHVRKEVWERPPPRTNRNAPAAVISEARMLRIVTAADHLFPTVVGRRARASVGSVERSGARAVKTAATSGVAALQVFAADDWFAPAIARTCPERLSPLPGMRKPKHGQATKAPPRDISASGHDGSSRELLCQEAARRFSGGPSRVSTMFCGCLQ